MFDKGKLVANDVIVRNADIDSADIDGEIAMMNIEKGRYYGFNDVGSRIWELINTPVTIKQVTDILLKEYDVDVKECEKSVLEFINRLYNEELITKA